MQVRAAVLPNRPLVNRPQAPASATAGPGSAPQPAQPIKARNADGGFGSDIFQSALYSLTNLAQVLPLGSLSGLIQMLPLPALGVFDLVLGGMNGVKDYMGLKKPNNVRRSDDYTRLAGDAAVVAGGAILLGGAFIAPWLPLVGAGLAGAGFLARAVGVWNDESRW